MNTYHKIQTVWVRNPTNPKLIMDHQWARPEFEYLKDSEWVFTEKVDGTNIRVMWDGGISFGGKTDKAVLYKPLQNRLYEIFSDKHKTFLKLFEDKEACLYGEGYGNRIQKIGKLYNPDGVDFVLFDVKVGRTWLSRDIVEAIGSDLGLKVVPIVYTGTLLEGIELVQAGFNSTWGDFKAEGLVGRPKVELLDCMGRRVITKIKSRDFGGEQ